MPINDMFDAAALFRRHETAFTTSTTLAGFVQSAGLTHLEGYMGGWLEKAYETAKVGKCTVYRPLQFPRAEQFSDLFTNAYFLATEAKGKPAGVCFISGYRGDAAPCGHMGGRRGYTPGTNTRCHYGAKFYGTYVTPRPEVKALVEAHIGAYGGYSYEAIRRDDGILVTARCSQIIGSVWLALLDKDADIQALFDADTRAFIAAEKQADIDAWGG